MAKLNYSPTSTSLAEARRQYFERFRIQFPVVEANAPVAGMTIIDSM